MRVDTVMDGDRTSHETVRQTGALVQQHVRPDPAGPGHRHSSQGWRRLGARLNAAIIGRRRCGLARLRYVPAPADRTPPPRARSSDPAG